MKIKFQLIVSLFLLAAVFTSCSKKSNIPVPEDAGIVMHINGASLSSKLPWEEIKQSEWFKLAHAESKDELANKILDNPDSSGVDIKSDAYLFVKVTGRGGYTGFTCKIKDEKAFASFIAKINEGKTIEKESGLSIIKSGSAVFTWNSDRFLVIGDSPDLSAGYKMMGNNGNSESHHYSSDSLLKFAKETYDLKGDKSIGNNSKFAAMMKEEGDVHFWINSGALYGNALPAMLSLTKASLLFDGNIAAATLSFDNGKISIKGKSYVNKELAALYKKYPMKNIDETMLKKIPGEVAAVMAMNYPPEGLKEFIKLLGVDGLANSFLSQAGFSTDDFVKANKGDILFSVSDFTWGEKEEKYTVEGKEYSTKTSKPDAKILFATSVNDKASFEKMIGVLNEQINKQGDIAKQMAGKIPYQLKDNWFIAGNDSASVFGFGSKSMDHSFISKISGHPMGGYIDIQKFISAARSSMTADSTALFVADESLKIWQDIIFHGGEFSDDGMESIVEINMVDKTTNSLKQLNKYFGTIAVKIKEDEKRKAKEYDDIKIEKVEADSTVAPKSN